MEVYHQQALSAIWFEFLAWLFGAWFMIRLFLYVVRQALPAGAGRSTIIALCHGVHLGHHVSRLHPSKLDGVLRKLDSWNVTLSKNTISRCSIA